MVSFCCEVQNWNRVAIFVDFVCCLCVRSGRYSSNLTKKTQLALTYIWIETIQTACCFLLLFVFTYLFWASSCGLKTRNTQKNAKLKVCVGPWGPWVRHYVWISSAQPAYNLRFFTPTCFDPRPWPLARLRWSSNLRWDSFIASHVSWSKSESKFARFHMRLTRMMARESTFIAIRVPSRLA